MALIVKAEGKGLEHPKKTREIRALLPKAVQIPVQLPIRRSLPADLARVVAAWPTLAASIRRAILALLDFER